MIGHRYKIALSVAIDALWENKLRSMLTTLGMIFGVAAVITMLSIGKGAEHEIMEQIKHIGLNNIMIKSKMLVTNEESSEKKNKFSPGLGFRDIELLSTTFPGISRISPVCKKDVRAVYKEQSKVSRLIAVSEDYQEIMNIKTTKGTFFNSQHYDMRDRVCVIGKKIALNLFNGASPVGEFIKCDKVWFKIVGVFKTPSINEESERVISVQDGNNDIIVPASTFATYVQDRSLVNKKVLSMDDDEKAEMDKNYHQLDEIIVQAEKPEYLTSLSNVIHRFLLRRHNQVEDFDIEIPIHLIEQQQKSKDIFNFVLLAIACISLLVGGIGIMNIMLASVLERVKEIGIRIAIGAHEKDVINQFIFESILLSVGGGILGVILGVGLSLAIEAFLDIKTILSGFSIFISFAISAMVGIVFGIMPARKAAKQDPVISLRN